MGSMIPKEIKYNLHMVNYGKTFSKPIWCSENKKNISSCCLLKFLPSMLNSGGNTRVLKHVVNLAKKNFFPQKCILCILVSIACAR